MSRVVKVYNSNYKVAVQPGGEIKLDTGDLVGNTVITGNLEVKGTTTTVDSTVVTIADNIIVLSAGTDSGLPASVGYVSGIEIDRGDLPNAEWLFDEQISWDLGGTSGTGTFYAITGRGTIGAQKLPINTPGIVSQGNLYVNTGAGVITVTNTVNYEEKVWNYANSVITPDPTTGAIIVDDDNIPNAKAVKDYVEYVFANEFYDTIAEGDTSVEIIDQTHTLGSIVSVTSGNGVTTIQTLGQHGFNTADTVDIFGVSSGDAIENLNGTAIQITEIVSATAFRVNVDTTGANVANYVINSGTVRKTGFEPSRVKITVDGVNNTNVYDDRFETQDIRIEGSAITTTSSNQDLEIGAPGTGSVKINDNLEIPFSPYENDLAIDPLAPVEGIKMYAKVEGPGQTGLYYVNSNNTSDEIVSRNRSLLFSMIF